MSAILIAIAAAWWDTRERRIPNALNVAGLVLGIVMHGWEGVAAAVVALVVFGAVWAGVVPRWRIGGGDVKLAAALAACLGPWPAFMTTAWLLVLLLGRSNSRGIRSPGAVLALYAVMLEEVGRCL